MDEDAVVSLPAAILQQFFRNPARHSVGSACQARSERVQTPSVNSS